MKRILTIVSIIVMLFLNSCVSSEIKGARDGDLNAVREYVSQGGDVNEKKNGGMTLLMYAAAGGHIQIIDYLMAQGADLRIRDNRGYTALLHGASAGRNNSLDSLLGYGASLDDRDNQGRSALMISVSRDLYGTAEYLLDRGIDPLTKDNSGWSALLLALDKSAEYDGGFHRIYDLLAGRGLSFSITDAPVPDIAFHAARSGNRDVLDLFLGKGLDRNIRSSSGDTLLHAGVLHENMADYLLGLGLDKNGVNRENETPLILAVKGDAIDSVRLLMREDAWLEQRDRSGKTALLYSADGDELEILRMLIVGGADIFITDREGNTALHLAAKSGTPEGVRLLLTAGIYVNSTNGDGKTPYEVSFANITRGEEIRRILVTAGAVVPETEKESTDPSAADVNQESMGEVLESEETEAIGFIIGQPAEDSVEPETESDEADEQVETENTLTLLTESEEEESLPEVIPADEQIQEMEPAVQNLLLSWPRINPSRAKGWNNRDKLTSRGRLILRYEGEGKKDVTREITLSMQGVNVREGSLKFEAEWNGSDPVTLIMILETEQGKSLVSEYSLGGDDGAGPVFFDDFRYE